MEQIGNLTNQPKQSISFALNNGADSATMTLKYHSNLNAWYFSLTYRDFSLNNRRLYSNPNILRQWHKTLPFGISCFSTDGQDPYFLNDFINERIYIYILTEQEIENYESFLSEKRDEV